MAKTCRHENHCGFGGHVPPLFLQSPLLRLKGRTHQPRHRFLGQHAHHYPHSQRLGNQIRRPLRTHVRSLQTSLHCHRHPTINGNGPRRAHQNRHHIHNRHSPRPSSTRFHH